jgi:hypothetical protein
VKEAQVYTYFVGKNDGKLHIEVTRSEAERAGLTEEAARGGWTLIEREFPPPDPFMDRLVFGDRR